MTEFPVPLDNLIAYVKSIRSEGGPLEHVADAFQISEQLDEQADALLGYFVDQARRSGASWSQIGAAMGVSKQAAQKRFVPDRAGDQPVTRGEPFSRFTPRAARVLAAAGMLADGGSGSQTRKASIGTAQLVAALFAEPGGLAAKTIAGAGLTPEQVYAAVGAGPAPTGVPVDVDWPVLADLEFGDDAQSVLKGALRSALRLGHNYIGTEHVLLGVFVAGGPVADALSGLGLSQSGAEDQIVGLLADYAARRSSGE